MQSSTNRILYPNRLANYISRLCVSGWVQGSSAWFKCLTEQFKMANAIAYNELSKPQCKTGCDLIDKLNISQGAKVLDMGCGTGHVSKYIADIVGPDGQVVAIDPDEERIKIAQENYKEVGHLQFHIGDSVTGFPHDDEPYYDFHVSTSVFHWLSNEEKQIYVRKAYRCLKLGGKLGIWCAERVPGIVEKLLKLYHPLTQDGYGEIFQNEGRNVLMERVITPYSFKTLDEFKRWFKASSGIENPEEYIEPAYTSKLVIKEANGGITFKHPRVAIVGDKN